MHQSDISAPLEHDCDSLSSADTCRADSVLLVEADEVVDEIGGDPRPRSAERVAESCAGPNGQRKPRAVV